MSNDPTASSTPGGIPEGAGPPSVPATSTAPHVPVPTKFELFARRCRWRILEFFLIMVAFLVFQMRNSRQLYALSLKLDRSAEVQEQQLICIRSYQARDAYFVSQVFQLQSQARARQAFSSANNVPALQPLLFHYPVK